MSPLQWLPLFSEEFFGHYYRVILFGNLNSDIPVNKVFFFRKLIFFRTDSLFILQYHHAYPEFCLSAGTFSKKLSSSVRRSCQYLPVMEDISWNRYQLHVYGNCPYITTSKQKSNINNWNTLNESQVFNKNTLSLHRHQFYPQQSWTSSCVSQEYL